MAAYRPLLQPFGEFPFDAIPASNGAQQFAHPVAMLPDFFLQFATIARQVALRFRILCRYADDVHPVTLAAQPAQQADHQLDGVEPVGLGPACPALHRDAGGIDYQYFVPQCLQGALYPEPVLPRFVDHYDPCPLGQPPLLFRGFDDCCRFAQPLGCLLARHCMD